MDCCSDNRVDEDWTAEALYQARQILGIGPNEPIVGDLPDSLLARIVLETHQKFCQDCQANPEFHFWTLNKFGCCYCSKRHWGPSPYQWRKLIEKGEIPRQINPSALPFTSLSRESEGSG